MRREMERLQQELDEAKDQLRQQETQLHQLKPVVRKKKTLEELIADEIVGHVKDAREAGRVSGKAASDREYKDRIVSIPKRRASICSHFFTE